MIRMRDATMLALTKLRTRKVRLTVTIVVSGLLFSALAGASFVARGVMGGVDSFGKEGLGDRFIVQAYPHSGFDQFSNPEIIDRALVIQKDIVAHKKAEAKRLGLAYDAASERSPVQEFEYPGGKQRNLDITHPAAEQAIQEYSAQQVKPDKQMLTTLTDPYKPLGIYSSKMLPFDQKGGQLQVLKDGQEDYSNAGRDKSGPPSGTDSFIGMWSVMSRELLEPFTLPGQNLETGADGSSPIIVPRQAAEQLLGLKELPASATPKDRLERTKEIREKAPSVRFAVCYRNAASADLVQQAISTKQEIEQNQNKTGYQKPDLIYGLPTEPCGSAPVTRDVRSKEQKTLDDKQRQFDEIFGATAPAQATITFRIVGIVPDLDYGSAFGVAEILRSLVTSSLGSGWYTPIEQLDQNQLLGTLFNQPNLYTSEILYVEFASANDARTFIETENCTLDYNEFGPDKEQFAACMASNRGFSVMPYGSNSLALESAKRGFGKFFSIAALVVSGIAALIMMGTVGRMIADSRRETAVFRAIGAKKLDIAQIYIIYVICLSLLISLFALIVGLVMALIAHDRWSADVTIQAITAYNAQDLDKVFSLYAFHLPDMLLLAGLSLAAGLISAVLPLFRNLRRNPIRDMRDDT